MPEFKLSKEAGTKKFELSIAIDYDEDGILKLRSFMMVWTGLIILLTLG